MAVEPIRAKIIEEAKHIENDTLYSAKGHYEAAKYWRNLHLLIGIPTVVLSATAGASALTQFDYHNIIAGFLAITVAALTALTTFLNPNEKANSHQNAGDKFSAIRNGVRMFYNIDSSLATPEHELIRQLKDFAKQRDELNQSSLPISGWAYKTAQRVIKNKAIETANTQSRS
jgi:hypothetical protein